ncbi:hypothetical protein [Radicibacter daui]|uniref:hypothetical protein n=1 Tax=Radicibacter daui TaxID=3064829 RepID=UPI004046F063
MSSFAPLPSLIQFGRRGLIALSVAALLVTACGKKEEAKNSPWFSFSGGGFVFNYREAEAYYGFIAKVERTLPENATVEASFENPAGGPDLVLTQPAMANRITYVFQSPPLTGIVKAKPYKATLRLKDNKSGKLLGEVTTSFTSSEDQSVMPLRPLVEGPADSDTPSWLR